MKDFKVYQASGVLNKFTHSANDVRPDYQEVSGETVQFYSPIYAPIYEMNIGVNPRQAGSGIPSPTNIRPISGVSACTIFHSGEDITNYIAHNVDLSSAGTIFYGATIIIDSSGNGILYKIMDYAVFNPSGWSWGWSYYSTGGYFRSSKFSSIKAGVNNQVPNVLNDMLNPVAPNRIEDLSITISTDRRIIIKDDSLNGNVSALNQKYDPTIIVYEKATISEYPVSLTNPITTYLGINNIWTDWDNIEIKYSTH